MQPRWYDLPEQELEAIYNPRVAAADVDAKLALFASNSAKVRFKLASLCRVDADIRFGPGAKETLDLYRPLEAHGSTALAVFVHGGFWRGLDKLDHSFVVPSLLEAGAMTANVNYDLCPMVTLDEIVAQIIRALRHAVAHASAWGADPDRVILLGHSAGAHLIARVMNSEADEHGLPAELVAGVVAISGVYEPEVVTRLSVNEEAKIDLETARRNDCLQRPPLGHARYVVWAGADEPAGWIDQSRLYAELVANSGMPCEYFELPGTDHFSVLTKSFEVGSSAFEKIHACIGSARKAI